MATPQSGNLPCQPNGDCTDPCIYFNDGTVFVETDTGAQLLHNKQPYILQLESSRTVKSPQGNDEVPGHIRVAVYTNKDLRTDITYGVSKTSCYYKNAVGEYESTDKCCWTAYQVVMKLITKKGKKILKTKWSSGC